MSGVPVGELLCGTFLSAQESTICNNFFTNPKVFLKEAVNKIVQHNDNYVAQAR